MTSVSSSRLPCLQPSGPSLPSPPPEPSSPSLPNPPPEPSGLPSLPSPPSSTATSSSRPPREEGTSRLPAAAVAARARPDAREATAASSIFRAAWCCCAVDAAAPGTAAAPLCWTAKRGASAAAAAAATLWCSLTRAERVPEVWTRAARAAWAGSRLSMNSSDLIRSMDLPKCGNGMDQMFAKRCMAPWITEGRESSELAQCLTSPAPPTPLHPPRPFASHT